MKSVMILTPVFSPNIGGVETHLDDLVRFLSKRGHKITVLTYQPITSKIRAKPFETMENVIIHRYSWPGFNLFHKLEPFPVLEFLYITPYLMLRALLFLLFHRKTVDVIHAHGFNAAFIARIMGFFFKKNIVNQTHTIYNLEKDGWVSRIAAWAMNGSNGIVALAKKSKKELIDIGVYRPIDIYTYWVAQDKFCPGNKKKARDELGWPYDFVVIFVSRLIPQKGPDILIKAASKVNKNIHFIVVGEGPMEEELKRKSSQIENITFVGKIDNSELPKYFRASDILVLPSRSIEGFPRVIVEALSCGVPVIGADRGGIPEAITDKVGILSEPTEVDFAKNIESLYANRKQYEELRKNTVPYATQKFSENNAFIIEKALIHAGTNSFS